MKTKKQFLFIILCVVLFLTLLLPACNRGGEKKAIIILPGIMASGLYDTQTGKPVWDPFLGNVEFNYYINHRGTLNMSTDDLEDFVEEIFPIIEDIMLQNDDSILKLLGVDENGVPLQGERIAPVTMEYSNPERLRYGLFNNSKELYDELTARYGNMAEITVFNYDWRLSNLINAEKLETYINGKGYDKVTIVAHSMGGVVASSYLARSEANRNKIDCLLTLDTPYLGAGMALEMLENSQKLIGNILNDISKISLISTYLDSFYPGCAPGYGVERLLDILDEDLLPILNIESVFQLLPSYELLSTGHYYNSWEKENYEKKTGFVKVNGKDITSKEELLNFYKSRPFAKKQDNTLKPQMAGLESFWDSMMVEKDGKKVHVSSLVNTHYFAGINYNTSLSLNFDAPLSGNLPVFSQAEYNGETLFSTLGDGTVLAYSATAGKLLNASNVHIVENADHFDVLVNFKNYASQGTFKVLDEIYF